MLKLTGAARGIAALLSGLAALAGPATAAETSPRPGVILANASNCYQIQNQDRKYFCLAQANGNASYCYQIQDRNWKYMCLAKNTSQKSYCYQIQDGDTKNQCLSLF